MVQHISVKSKKQRKNIHNAPAHIRHKQVSSRLSNELYLEHKIRSLPLRVGDTITVMRGDFKGAEGKVSKINNKKFTVLIDGINREKADGSTISVPINTSKVIIKKLNLDDKFRKNIIERYTSVKSIADLGKD